MSTDVYMQLHSSLSTHFIRAVYLMVSCNLHKGDVKGASRKMEYLVGRGEVTMVLNALDCNIMNFFWEYLAWRGEETMVSTTLDCDITNEKIGIPGWARRRDHGVDNTRL